MSQYGLRWHDICIPSFINIDTGFQGILWLSLSNLNGCNVGITEGRVLLSAPLKWAQVALCMPSSMTIGSGI
jgi:hypothetical protein